MSALLFAIGVPLMAQAQSTPRALTEAPSGFDTPTLVVNPGSQSVSNGIVEPTGDSFELDQKIYESIHDVNNGLGPVFNGRACAECHQNPVSGGASQFTELRAGHSTNGTFVNPTVTINDGANTITGRSIVNDRAVVPQAQEKIPATENLRELRATLTTLGDGFVEAVADTTLQDIAKLQPLLTGGKIHGEAIQVPLFEAPGQTRVGRFGWKDQHGSLLSFTADAYVKEMGVTNRLRPNDVTSVGKVTTDPEDVPDALGLATVQDTAFKFRTAALWGLRTRPRYMHDLLSVTLQSAIERHHGEAEHVTHRFNELTDAQKQQVFTFLNSL
jgi:CxxC motif-containing protein (DUF1111 family)